MGSRSAGLLALCLGLVLALASSAAPDSAARDRPSAGPILTAEIRQPITVATEEYVKVTLARARDEHAEAVLFDLDTPGGALDATRSIVQAMLASEVPIIVYVSPAGAHAGSAGVFITMAANIAAMQPSSNIGAAHPVSSSGQDVQKEAGKDMARKIENDTAAFAMSIAKARGRNEEWAEKAVRESAAVTADQALKLHVVDLTAKDTADLLQQIDGRTVTLAGGSRVLHTREARLVPVKMTIREHLLAVLADPNLAALLMLLGMFGIGFEFYNPGSIYPGVVGAIALILGLLATEVIPVNAGAILLILAGAALLITEAYVPTHGAAGLLGTVCLLLGMLLFIDKSSPDYHFDPGSWRLSPLVVWPAPIALGLIMLFVASRVAVTRRRPLLAGAPGLIGEHGEALSQVGPSGGEVFVHGEYWKARSAEVVPQGSRVRVVEVDGLVAKVVVDTSAPAR